MTSDLDTEPTKLKCKGVTRKGVRCGNDARKGKEYCWIHELQYQQRQPRFIRWYRRIRSTIVVIVIGSIIGYALNGIGLLADLSQLGIVRLSTQTMSGDLRIAVAGFGQEEEKLGTQLANGVHLDLTRSFDSLELEIGTVIWGPEQVGSVFGSNFEERALSAASLAEKIKADIVVYGVIEGNNPGWSMIPEFYLSPDKFYDAVELTGPHLLGKSIHLEGGDSIADRISVSDELSARTEVLSYILIGLSYYSPPHVEYETALGYFQEAESIPLWKENEGLEVIYLLMGNAASKQEKLGLAQAYYEKSIELDPEYSRGYLGLGDVYYRSSLELFDKTKNPESIDPDLLTLAIENYTSGLSSDDQPQFADVPTKVHFGLGQCYLAKTYSSGNDNYTSAENQFMAVIQDYGNGENARVRVIAAESHARLGLIYSLIDQTEEARDEYMLAISLLPDVPDRRALFERRLNELSNIPSTISQ